VHQAAFSQLQLKEAGRQAGFIQNPGNPLDKSLLPNLDRGNVHRHGHRMQARLQPGLILPAGFAQHPATDRHNQAALFRDCHEVLRVDESEDRIAPADECLATGEGPGSEIDLGLVMQHELSLPEGPPEAGFNKQAAHCVAVHVGREELVLVAAACLGVVHRSVRVLQHGIHTGAVIGIDADADAQGHMQFVLANALWLGKRDEQLFRDQGSILRLLDFGEKDHELVTALAAYGVRGTHAR